ncbi:hypothetical protein K402DRAFT_163097 [Aulographum hederae CBS 113979]|uniref:Uncharacterized protein n=1 Tax=Aulographum hederae CBS 113979 TaxID=1176131 RepID=A0A6G1GRW2_9PEZI|nr:hypothetical protein K402DRAFT_163097 [Aulographum hederae CBS 113979]
MHIPQRLFTSTRHSIPLFPLRSPAFRLDWVVPLSANCIIANARFEPSACGFRQAASNLTTTSMNDKRAFRLSSSPAASVQVVQAPLSPVESVHPDMEHSIYRRPDLNLRTEDFFDDTTDEEHPGPADRTLEVPGTDAPPQERRSSSPRSKANYLGVEDPNYASQCRDDSALGRRPERESQSHRLSLPFLRLTETPISSPISSPQQTYPYSRYRKSSIDSSYDASIEGMVSGTVTTGQGRPMSVRPAGPSRLVHNSSPRVSAIFSSKQHHIHESPLSAASLLRESKIDPQFPHTLDQSPPLPPLPPAHLGDHILRAHDITIQALIRGDEDTKRQQTHSRQASLLQPQQAALFDSFRLRTQSAATTGSGIRKRVSLVPPPIDISAERHPIPDDIVRTPYPFTSPSGTRRVRRPDPLAPIAGPLPSELEESHDSVLTVSVRRGGWNGSSFSPSIGGNTATAAGTDIAPPPLKVSRLPIPATHPLPTFPVPVTRHRSTRSKTLAQEKVFKTLDYDDEAFFRALRAEYCRLVGGWRVWLSARSLKRIVVGYSSACAYCRGNASAPLTMGYGDEEAEWFGPGFGGGCGTGATPWHITSRSPRLLAAKGLTDSFSEERLMELFRKPSLGKNRFAWVYWAKRLAASSESGLVPRARTPVGVREMEMEERERWGDEEGEGEGQNEAERAGEGKGEGKPQPPLKRRDKAKPKSKKEKLVKMVQLADDKDRNHEDSTEKRQFRERAKSYFSFDEGDDIDDEVREEKDQDPEHDPNLDLDQNDEQKPETNDDEKDIRSPKTKKTHITIPTPSTPSRPRPPHPSERPDLDLLISMADTPVPWLGAESHTQVQPQHQHREQHPHRSSGANQLFPPYNPHTNPNTNPSPHQYAPHAPLPHECAATLALITTLSIRRILFALLLVTLLSISGTLLWIFLGPNLSIGGVGGFREAGGRVGGGVLVGGLVLGGGWVGVGMWVGGCWVCG